MTAEPLAGAATSPAPILRTEALSMQFGGLTALGRVDFAVERGDHAGSMELAAIMLAAWNRRRQCCHRGTAAALKYRTCAVFAGRMEGQPRGCKY